MAAKQRAAAGLRVTSLGSRSTTSCGSDFNKVGSSSLRACCNAGLLVEQSTTKLVSCELLLTSLHQHIS